MTNFAKYLLGMTIILAGCSPVLDGTTTTIPGDGTTTTTTTTIGTIILMPGYCNDDMIKYYGCVWTNGILVWQTNEEDIFSYVNAAVQSGTNIYTCGYRYVYAVDDWQACYWKNGSLVSLTNDAIDNTNYSLASDIFVSGSHVYAGGQYYDPAMTYLACYWDNGNQVTLTNAGSMVSSIVAQGSDVLMCGNVGGRAVYWFNNMGTGLHEATNSYAYDIYAGGGNVYICGKYYDTGLSRDVACYWINGTEYALTNDANLYSIAYSIDLLSTNIVIVGMYENAGAFIACYWYNGSFSALTNTGDGNSEAMIIQIDGEDIYIGGNYQDGGIDMPCYWKNGEFYVLPEIGYGGRVTRF